MSTLTPSPIDPNYFYVCTALPPTTTTRAVRGQFTHNDETRMLILAKGNRLVAHAIHPEGIDLLSEQTVYGRIDLLEVIRPQGKTYDMIFLCTDRHDCCLLKWEKEGYNWITVWSGRANEAVGRLRDQGFLSAVDPNGRFIAVHTYQSIIKIFPFCSNTDHRDSSRNKKVSKGKGPADARFKTTVEGEVGEIVTFRIEELNIVSMCFLESETPTIAILYEDSFRRRHLKTYIVPPLASNDPRPELLQGRLSQPNIASGSAHLLAILGGGLLIIGDRKISYRHSSSSSCDLVIASATLEAFIVVDREKILVADAHGYMFALTLEWSGENSVQSINWIQMGTTSIATCLAYLGNGLVFVGSHCGDSMLVRLPSDMLNHDSSRPLQIVDLYANVAPITDFEVVDYDHQGQGQLVSCSGISRDGSLRVIRSGVGVQELAFLELSGIEGVWSLKEATYAMDHKFLVLSFIGETRVIKLAEDGEMEEAIISGIPIDRSTVYVADVNYNQWLHVSHREIRLLEAPVGRLSCKLTLPAKIHAATLVKDRLLISYGQGCLACYDVVDKTLNEVGKCQLDQEIACIAVHPEHPDTCAVGLWNDISVHVLQLPGMDEIYRDVIGGQMILRSLQFAVFENSQFLLVTTGDGQLYHYVYDRAENHFKERKRIVIGMQPIHLSSFQNVGGKSMIFASSDRPSIIYSTGKLLSYAPVDLKNVDRICSFASNQYGNALAIINRTGLSISRVDEIRKLHIRKVALGEQARRLSHQESTRTFGVITIQYASTPNGTSRQFFRLLDDQTFEVLDSHQMGNYEIVQSIASVTFQNERKPYHVVGTGFVFPGEEEPKKGRILVFAVTEARQIQLITTMDVKGAVFTLKDFHGMLLCGVNSRVFLLKWTDKATRDEGPDLMIDCSHHGHIMALNIDSYGEYIAVGDLMKSVSILKYHAAESRLEEVARDFNSNWMTAVAMLSDNTVIGAESGYNLFAMRRESEAVEADKRKWLQIIGTFHTGESINRFKSGSLVYIPPDNEDTQQIAYPRLLYGTVTGMIGVIALISEETYLQLHQLMINLSNVVKSIGGFQHSMYRNFKNDRQTKESQGFIDGDLVEQFLELSPQKMDMVVNGTGLSQATPIGLSVDETLRLVGELSHLH